MPVNGNHCSANDDVAAVVVAAVVVVVVAGDGLVARKYRRWPRRQLPPSTLLPSFDSALCRTSNSTQIQIHCR